MADVVSKVFAPGSEKGPNKGLNGGRAVVRSVVELRLLVQQGL